MQTVYDAYDEDKELGAVPITEKQREVLDAGGTITVTYHTPQLMQGALGNRNGSFQVRKDGDRLVSTTPNAVKDFAQLQAAIAAARSP